MQIVPIETANMGGMYDVHPSGWTQPMTIGGRVSITESGGTWICIVDDRGGWVWRWRRDDPISYILGPEYLQFEWCGLIAYATCIRGIFERYGQMCKFQMMMLSEGLEMCAIRGSVHYSRRVDGEAAFKWVNGASVFGSKMSVTYERR